MSDARFQALFEELSDIVWDVIILVETWRVQCHEQIVLESGHTFYGSGGFGRSCGVGFLVNQRHRKVKFTNISPRLAFVDLKVGSAHFRLFGVYFPDSSHSDDDVECVYEELDVWLHKSRHLTALLPATSTPRSALETTTTTHQ